MKIYTRTGDSGDTGLFGGPRVRKDDVRIEAFGTVDELNAVLGMVRTEHSSHGLPELLESLQHDLFVIGAELATAEPGQHTMPAIGTADVERLEGCIDQYEADLAPLKQFILPGGSPTGATFHVARAVCRRAERRVITLQGTSDTEISATIVVYLNRLSDLLFVLARIANQQAGQPEIAWKNSTAD
jgi:cob(I)alamin adenosyltransferase